MATWVELIQLVDLNLKIIHQARAIPNPSILRTSELPIVFFIFIQPQKIINFNMNQLAQLLKGKGKLLFVLRFLGEIGMSINTNRVFISENKLRRNSR